jgi:pimeloyl-ACP methyl ester carboxylesterase
MAGFAGVEPSENPTFDNWKSRIVDFIKEENIEKPIIIGHSMGGGLAMAIAADYPKLIKKFVIVDALPCLAALSNPNFEQRENVDCSTSINQINAMSDEQFYQMQKNTISQLTTNQEMTETIVDWIVNSDRKTFAKMYCDFLNTDLREKIKTIQCPSLVLLESYFKNFKPAIEEQYKNLKTSNLEYANKGLHFIMYDDKEWYFDQLSNFIKSN